MKLIYMHMPKCAGRSIQDLIQRNTEKWNVINDSDILAYVEVEAANQFDAIMGHLHWGVVSRLTEFKVATVLRDPLERAISHYNHLMTAETSWVSAKIMREENYSFMDFLTSNHRAILGLSNSYTLYFMDDSRVLTEETMIKSAQDNLRKLDFVGIYEELPETIRRMKERYGLKGDLQFIGKTPESDKAQISEEDRKEAVKHLWDYEVYNTALEIFGGG